MLNGTWVSSQDGTSRPMCLTSEHPFDVKNEVEVHWEQAKNNTNIETKSEGPGHDLSCSEPEVGMQLLYSFSRGETWKNLV